MTRKIKALKTIGHHRFENLQWQTGLRMKIKNFEKKKKKKDKFHLTKVLSYDMMVVAKKVYKKERSASVGMTGQAACGRSVYEKSTAIGKADFSSAYNLYTLYNTSTTQ